MRMRIVATTVIFLITSLSWGRPAPAARAMCLAGPDELRPVILEIAAKYQEQAGIEVETAFYADPADLRQEIFLPGRPGVLLAALQPMDQAIRKDRVAGGSRTTLFYQRLALGVQVHNPKLIFALSDLSRPGIRIGILKPHAGDLGAATRALLDKEDPGGKLAKNIVFQSDSVRDLADSIAGGGVDVVICWDTLKGLHPDKVCVMRLAGYRGRPLEAGIMKAPSRDAATRQLADFVAAEPSRRIYEKHGYSLVEDPASEVRDSDFYRNFHHHKFFYTYQLLAQQLVDDYGIKEGIALDVGCGGCQTLIHLARITGLQCVGLDVEPEILEVAGQNVKAAGLQDRFRFVAGDAHHLPLPEAYANLIISRGSIPFWHDRARAIQEIYRVLKPGGVAFVGIGGSRYLTEDYYRKMQAPWLIAERREWLDIPDAHNLEEVMDKTDIPAANYRIVRDSGHWVEIRK